MTQDLSNLFEEQVKLFKRGLSSKSNGTTRTRQNARRRARGLASTSGQSPAPSASRHYRRLQEIVDDDDEDAEIDVINGDAPSTSTQRRSLGRPRKTNPTNGVSSTHNLDATPGPSTSTAASRRRTATTTTPRQNVEDGSDTSSSGDSTETSSSEAEATDGSSVRVADMANVSRSMSARKRARNNSDSEESYRPTQQKKKNGSVRKGRPKLNGTKRGNTSRRYATQDDDEDDDDDDEIANGRRNGHRKLNGTTPAKRGRPRKYLRSEDDQPADDGGDDGADDENQVRMLKMNDEN